MDSVVEVLGIGGRAFGDEGGGIEWVLEVGRWGQM